jgi:carbon-monoxide dehydrogenase large subunit
MRAGPIVRAPHRAPVLQRGPCRETSPRWGGAHEQPRYDGAGASAVSDGPPWVGRPLRRREDPRYLCGQAQYVDDLVLPRMVHLAIVRSPYPHARIRAIDTAAARGAPGVVAVLTASDLSGRLGVLLPTIPEGSHATMVPHPVLATGKVRYVGEPVAAVVAESREEALDAAALVTGEYDPLPPVLDPQNALRGDVLLHDDLGENVFLRWSCAHGEVDAALRAADRVVRGVFQIPRMAAAPIEPRGAVAAYDAGSDVVTVWCSAQGPHRPLVQLERLLKRPADRIRVIVRDVGGAFGSKGAVALEAAVAACVAIDLHRPVKWVETRRENFLASHQGRGMRGEVEMAVDRDGRIRAVRARLLADLGAYLYPATATAPVMTASLLTGVYAIPAADVELVGVATSKVPTGPCRGAGRPEATYLVERMVDLVARDLNLDPVVVRRRNLIPRDRFPYRTALGLVYDSGDYERALAEALRLIDYDHWRAAQREARPAGRLLGIGVAMYIERAGSYLWESAAALVDAGGRVIVRTGSTPHGQGHETAFAQIAADTLDLDPDAIRIEHGDSAIVPRGVGTFGSRSITVGGSAVVAVLEKIQQKAIRIAAHLLEAAPEDIRPERGCYTVRGLTGRGVTFREIAAAAYQPACLPPGMEVGLSATASFALPGTVFPAGAYAAVVEVGRETGEIRVVKIAAVDDAGRIVNPLLAEGQVLGGIAQGLGEALMEQIVYDQDGQLVTATFGDYGLLRAAHMPQVDSAFVETPSPLNPLGAKGIGEAGAIATPAVIANAVMDALAPLGVRHLDLPLTPEQLWRCLAAAHAPE